jgi:hypothetical protein
MNLEAISKMHLPRLKERDFASDIKLLVLKTLNGCVAPRGGIRTNSIILRSITIRFKMLICRGKMPLPLFIIESRLLKVCLLLLEAGVASSHDICTLRF